MKTPRGAVIIPAPEESPPPEILRQKTKPNE
jgi:hypothetical protein